MGLSKADREQFLAEPRIGALAVQERPDRGPLIVPIWYDYRPGGELWILTEPDSRKGRAIAAAGRFGLMVERTSPTVRYVSVEGPVTRTEHGSRELTMAMASRYLAPEQAVAYTEYELTEMGEHWAFYLRPEHWLSADLGPG